MKRRTPLIIALATGTVAASAVVAVAAPATAQPVSPAAASISAANSAASFVAARPAVLRASAGDVFVQHKVISSAGLQYVPYTRTYKGLNVQGGDFVVATDAAGNTKYTSVAQTAPIGNLSITPKLTSAAALAIAEKKLKTVTTVEGTSLIVFTGAGVAPTLAWESTLRGTSAEGPSRQTIDVNATTGKVLRADEHVTDATGTGTGWVNGTVSLATTQSGSTYSLKDPSETNLSCQNASGNTTFTGPDNVWGTGVGTDRETGCVDALYIAQTQDKMLSAWLGRNGQDGNGGAWPLRVGLADENAYYDGTEVQIGHNTANQWITSADVVGHELGHGIDDKTPGSSSGGNTSEFVADTFGAATEWYANNPNDPPDFTVGEEVNLVGSGPIRYMYDPSIGSADNCYSSGIPSEEVHAAAGPGNHWFYLVAEGTNPTNNQPTSPTCNNSSVTGLGIQKAITIMYNAMLLKNSSSSYLKYRTWTLTAAKNLYPGSCAEFNTVKAAWDAVSVPAQSGDPTCTGSTTPPTTAPTTAPTTKPTTPPTGGTCTSAQLLGNPGFESGSGASWTTSSGVVSTASGSNTPQAGTYFGWLNGYGTAHTDTASQSVTIPAGCTNATLSFYLKVITAETGTTADDTLTVKAGSTTLATYSNLNKSSTYAQKSINLAAYKGQTVKITFTGTEDSSAATSFDLDTTALNVS